MSGGFGGGPWGGVPWGGAAAIVASPSPFDVFCFEDCTTMPGIFLDPDVSILGSAAEFTLLTGPPVCDLFIESGRSTDPLFPTDDAVLIVSKAIGETWTLEWTAKFEELPQNFSDVVNEHIYFGASDAAIGPIGGVFISKIGVMYTGSIHHDGGGNLVLHTSLQLLPGSSAYVSEGEYITFRLAADMTSGLVYFYVTKTADLLLFGHQLRAILPAIPASASAYPAFLVDRAVISVRGVTARPSKVSVEEFCLASSLIIPNIAPIANAGSDQAVRSCSIIQLDGTASFDPEGAPLLYEWLLVDAPLGSSSAVEEDDGFTLAGVGFTDHFYSLDLGVIDSIDPIQIGDVLLLNGEPFRITSTGTDFNGFFVVLTSPLIPKGLTGTHFKILRQRGVSGATTAHPTFFPDKPGFYKFLLEVNDGALTSLPTSVIVNVLESPLPRGCTPDLQFIFSYLSDFWNLVEDREKITVFWSAIAQVTATELYTLWQLEYSKSLRDIQRTFARRWLHYDLLLPEPVPELSKIRAVWGGVSSSPFIVTAGATELRITSPVLAAELVISLPLATYTPETLAEALRVALQVKDSRFSTIIAAANPPFVPQKLVRIDAPFAFTVSFSGFGVFTTGQRNEHLSNTIDPSPFDPPIGFAVGLNTFKVNRSLQDLDIQENDFLSLDGVALRIARIITDSSDALPFQRVVLKDPLPLSPPLSGIWHISGYVTSELLDFYNGLVSVGDPVFFEVLDDVGQVASNEATSTIIQCVALGAS